MPRGRPPRTRAPAKDPSRSRRARPASHVTAPAHPSGTAPGFTGSTICRTCGRLGRQAIPLEVEQALRSVAHDGPQGWELRDVSVSFLGFCPECLRTGRAVPS